MESLKILHLRSLTYLSNAIPTLVWSCRPPPFPLRISCDKHLARTIASSMAADPPCPMNGPITCMASPKKKISFPFLSFPAMFKAFRGSSEQNQPPQEIPTQSWYPPSVVGSSSNSSRPSTASSSQHQRASDQSHGQFSPTAAASIIGLLKDKSVDELRKLLTDKDAYNTFLHSLDQVKIQNNLRDELRKETMQLARENLEKEPRILELRNQCRIIRTTELAAAQEKLNGLEMKKEELLRLYSPSMLLQKMQDAINKAEEESEILHRQLLDKEIDLSAFVQKYKKLRTINHRRALIHLAAKTSSE